MSEDHDLLIKIDNSVDWLKKKVDEVCVRQEVLMKEKADKDDLNRLEDKVEGLKTISAIVSAIVSIPVTIITTIIGLNK